MLPLVIKCHTHYHLHPFHFVLFKVKDLVSKQHPTNTHTHTHTHTYIHSFIHSYIHTYIHTYIHSFIHTYIYTYIHTYIHTYVHTYIHAYATCVQHVDVELTQARPNPLATKGLPSQTVEHILNRPISLPHGH